MSIWKHNAVRVMGKAGPEAVVWGRKIILMRLQQLLKDVLNNRKRLV